MMATRKTHVARKERAECIRLSSATQIAAVNVKLSITVGIIIV
jgi:hypothetical protein